MFVKILFLALLFLNVNAQNTLNETYYTDTKTIKLNSIIPHARDDIELFEIEADRYTKRVRTQDLLKILKKHGYSDYSSKENYTNFVLKSPIDTSKIKLAVKEYYENRYDEIDIKNISVEPRSYTTSLPKEYSVNFQKKDYLQRDGVLSIKTKENKKIFFNYYVDAMVTVYTSRKKIKKDTELSAINSYKKSIILDRFKARPVQDIQISSIQSKHHISKDRILTVRDVEPLSIVKKDSFVNVSVYSNNMAISFSAKALQDGKLNDIIRVQKSDGKRLRVKVVGKNRAEIR